jgi:hypothetical protein
MLEVLHVRNLASRLLDFFFSGIPPYIEKLSAQLLLYVLPELIIYLQV